MDRLWGRLQDGFETASDQQRVERLEQCRVLESILQSCRQEQALTRQAKQQSMDRGRSSRSWWPFSGRAATAKSKESAGSSASDTTASSSDHVYQHHHVPTLENTPGGIRMLRFFHWRELPAEFPHTNCRREEHAVWACRAVAVGCGQPLTQLRDCFDEQGPERILVSRYTTKGKGANSQTSYTDAPLDDKKKTKIPCHDYQRAVGTCVASNLHDLQQRVERRNKATSSAVRYESTVNKKR